MVEDHGEGWKGVIRVNHERDVKCGSAGRSVRWEGTKDKGFEEIGSRGNNR